jgi:hypothetical protein
MQLIVCASWRVAVWVNRMVFGPFCEFCARVCCWFGVLRWGPVTIWEFVLLFLCFFAAK